MEKSITGYAAVNGINMYYQIYGEGTVPLVLIHGGGSTIETSFGTMLPLLTPFTKVVAVELQAHGRTTDRDTPELFEQDADDVAAVLAHLKITKANVLGYSNGGTTALQMAIRHPQMVNKIVVVSANYKREGMIPGFFEGMQNASLDNMPAVLKAAYLKVTPDECRLQVMFDKDVERMRNFKDMKDGDLQAIKAAALLMVADRDVILVEHTLAMSRLIPGAQLVVLPGTHGSFTGASEAVANPGSRLPGITAALVEEFLNG
jgi:pimeloyl-ACP methyl ester carboxylesterase